MSEIRQVSEDEDENLEQDDDVPEIVLEPVVVPDGVFQETAEAEGIGRPRFNTQTVIPYYKNIQYKSRGYFLIFNQDQFHRSTRQSSRKGSELDSKLLQKRFTELEFKVRVFRNKTFREIGSILERYGSKDHTEYQMFGMAILSHGIRNNKIYAYDRIMDISDFVNAFKPTKSPGLFRKPKLFFIQACRGSEIDHGVRKSTRKVANEVSSWPLDADILIHFATPEGRYAWRDPLKGSWFIQALCDRLRDAYRYEFHHLLIQVNAQVASTFETEWENSLAKEMPQILSQLTQQLFLRPVKR